MNAKVISFPNRGLAHRYAALMSLKAVGQDNYGEFFDEWLEVAQRLVERGTFSTEDLSEMIERRRRSLRLQLEHIDRI
ncbi:hypothetical protein LYSHEL_25450 [Lysobacter helvus]|uniref:Uncharacterized protein n=2 Tax=Lysobacteraceae TaxID=32033 RepID=A0ABM7Q7W4_9GAMM|nr:MULTISPECIES: hypothetical protein [Lysobacter]BCT93521.1 hypothetical protein LYSCAS_25450 [Lysobacter caseinilyticus]BCT96674.1 hypothetical protein LYSHEL_25450 [Lysobacter helvus]